MESDSDIVLVGTGVAPLVAAARLRAEERRVLVLNPDLDFFLEDSELPLDPLWSGGRLDFSTQRLKKNLRKRALSELRPEFPGAIELWEGAAPGAARDGFKDALAPHVRTRDRMWIDVPGFSGVSWDLVEKMYVEAADAGLNPQIMDGAAALGRFPGYSARPDRFLDARAVVLPKMCDVDVARYRNGLLEFVRESLGQERVLCDVSQMELMPGGVRFHHGKGLRTARATGGVMIFWTPRLTSWVVGQSRNHESRLPAMPLGIRLCEEWSLLSRFPLVCDVVGGVGDVICWAEVEGAPEPETRPLHRLSVLRAGSLVSDALSADDWASAASFRSLSSVCHDFLQWDKFSIRSLKTRALLEWEDGIHPKAMRLAPGAHVISGCDGPLVDVVAAVREACSAVLSAKGGGADA
ncbi:MAG: hypothetical protein A2583_11055 [Bdellovibrionales bacterium RIFOXYD1_FULL_53_11]|nr:MAG: hypothetical protein A2583_11055 [Bdellovibrionales bacterium RIFOXYD1_FULL_53_11]